MRILIYPLFALLAASCTIRHFRQGDDNLWRSEHGFEKGRTTATEVLAALGPPTQVFEFGTRMAFLYILFERRTNSIALVVYKDEEREYLSDRAVFFFTKDEILEEMGTSHVALPTEAAYDDDTWAPVQIEEEPAEPDS